MIQRPDTWIYFLRPVGLAGPIKIGWTRWPDSRLLQYMKWSPIDLELVAKVRGPQAYERRFHALFRPHHSHHEWFHAHPDITAVIEQVAAGEFDLSSLPRGCNLLQGPASAEAREWASAIMRLNGMVKRGEPVPPHVMSARFGSWQESDEERAHKREIIKAFMGPRPGRASPIRRRAA